MSLKIGFTYLRLLCLLLIFYPGMAEGQKNSSLNLGYQVGDLVQDTGPTPLSLFLPERITRAHPNLFVNLADARTVLEREVREHPDDLAAWVGYLQTIPEQWERLALLYAKEANEKKTFVAHFKAGVVLWYRLNYQRTRGGTIKYMEYMKSQNTAITHLQQAYNLHPTPLTGPMRGEAGGSVAFYEEMLHRFSDEKTYQTYLRAKKSGWTTPQPDIPNKSRNELLVLRRLIAGVISYTSTTQYIRHEKIVNGRQVTSYTPADYTPEQKKAMAYLDLWMKRLQGAADKAVK